MKRVVALTLCLSLVAPAVPCLAQAPIELEAARKKFDEALKLEKAGDFRNALRLMREVAQVKATSQVLFHLGVCLENLGRLVEARAEYLRAKAEAERKEGPDGAAMAQKSRDRVADLDARIPKIAFVLPEEIIGAKVQIDGGDPISLLVTPTVLVDPGQHKLVVTSPGRKTFTRTVLVKERDPVFTLEVELPKDDEEPPPPPEDETPKPVTTTTAKRPAPAAAPYPWPWIAFGVGGVALATGGIMYALRDSTIHDMDEACGPARDRCPRSMESTEERGRTYTSVGNVFLGIGAVAVTAGVVLLIAKPSPKHDTAVIKSFSVAATPSSIGLSMTF